jgi:ABC-type branched-subunit amino acid transport system substrate-binding protein
VGSGQVKVGLLLPLSAAGNAGAAAQSMRNAAELALTEFQNPNIQLLIKDDGGNAQGAQQGAQQAVDEGAEIILGPLFAQSVPGAAQVARNRGIPVIAFSTDSSVAGRGVYLLSFLPESDVTRIVDYAAGTGKRSFAAYLPENAYGNVVEVAFKQAVARKGGRLVAFEKYGADRAQGSAAIVQARERGSCYWRMTVTRLRLSRISSFRAAPISSACNCSARVCGTIRVCSVTPTCAADSMQRRTLRVSAASARYRAKYSGDPVRTATLAYDGVALVAALARTQGGQRFSPEVLTNPSGFAGIDGLFRFRGDGTNERGLAVMRVGPTGGTIVAGSPKSFGA